VPEEEEEEEEEEECVFAALFNQHAQCMRRIILSSMACLSLQYFSTSHKSHNLGGKNIIEHKIRMCFVRNISYSKKNSARCYHTCK